MGPTVTWVSSSLTVMSRAGQLQSGTEAGAGDQVPLGQVSMPVM
jgi:hypothetical protein